MSLLIASTLLLLALLLGTIYEIIRRFRAKGKIEPHGEFVRSLIPSVKYSLVRYYTLGFLKNRKMATLLMIGHVWENFQTLSLS